VPASFADTERSNLTCFQQTICAYSGNTSPLGHTSTLSRPYLGAPGTLSTMHSNKITPPGSSTSRPLHRSFECQLNYLLTLSNLRAILSRVSSIHLVNSSPAASASIEFGLPHFHISSQNTHKAIQTLSFESLTHSFAPWILVNSCRINQFRTLSIAMGGTHTP
jgi:hypothetical protein